MDKNSPYQMEEPSQDDVISLVNSIFEVTDFTKSEFSLEFKIGDIDFKSKFEELARRLESNQYACKLEQMNDGKYIIVQKFSMKKQGRIMKSSWTPRILFGIVIGFILLDGYVRTKWANLVIEFGDPIQTAIIYTIALMGILGTHEAGHIIASKIHRLKTTWPYFLPGIPIYGIPTFGAFIQSRGLTINREILFDVAIAGPIAGLVIAIIVSFYGAYEAPILEQERIGETIGDLQLREFEFGQPLFMIFTLAMFEKGPMYDSPVYQTPLMFAAWIGFLITFLNLMPAWQLDGGHMARTLFGAKIHKFATYGSLGVLVLLNFWPMAILIMIMSSRNMSAIPLDDISPVSTNRKISYVGVIVLAILCAPLPTEIISMLLS